MSGRSTAPDWPALMLRATAARYCDMTAGQFEGEVVSGRFPQPFKVGGAERWSRRALDESLDRLAGSAVPDWRQSDPRYAQG